MSNLIMRVMLIGFVMLIVAGGIVTTAPARADEKPVVNKPIIKRDPPKPSKDAQPAPGLSVAASAAS